MIADLYRTERPKSAHMLARMIGAFESDLSGIEDTLIATREDEERIVAVLSENYLRNGQHQMAEHVTGHYRRYCECFARCDERAAYAASLGLAPELVEIVRRKRIEIDSAMNIASHDAVRRLGGILADGIRCYVYHAPSARRGGRCPLRGCNSIAEAVLSLRDEGEAGFDWNGDTQFTIRVEM